MAILTGEGTTFTIATDDEAFSGADVNKAITPDQLLAVVSQSVAAVSGGLIYKGVFNATTLKPDLSDARQGDFYKVSVADTAYGETYAVGDMLLINADMGGTIDANKVDKIDNSESLTSLDDLTDVTLVNSNTGEVLRYNGTDWVNQEISADDLKADHTGVNYTGANTDSIETHLAGIDTALASAGGASNLDGLSDVTITGAAAGEVLRYSGAQWVDAQLSYNDLSNTPTLPSSSDDLTSDHTGTNYTGANTDTVTTHLSGIDSELNNRADTVNSVAVANGAVTIDGDDIIAPRTGTNYTGANTDTVTTHLSGIDSELNNRADTVNSVTVSNGAVTIDGDDIIAPRTGTNYTAANTDSITTHLAGIDTALASTGGFSSLVVSNTAAPVAVDANTFVTLSSTNTLYPWKIRLPATPADGNAIILTIASSGGQPAASRTDIEIYASDGITLLHEINANLDRCPVFVVYESATASWLISPSVEGMDLRTATSYSLNAYRFGYVPIIIYRNGTNNPAFGLTIPSAASVLNGETQEIILRGRRDLTITSGAQDIIDPTSSAEIQTLVTGITLRADAGSVKIRRIAIGGQGRWWLDAPLANLDAIPSSSDDLTSDHTGTNYTGANTDTVTTHLSGIDSELNNRADTVNSVSVSNGAVTIDGDDIIAPRTGTNYTAANTDTITTHLAGIDTALASAGGASDLDGLSDVTITGAATGEVLRYSGAQWVDAQLSYNDLSNTPTLPSSSDDLTSDHTGVNYTGANTDTVTTHLSGIDSELNNRADTVNSVAVSNGAVTIDGDDIIAPRTGTNYTGANTDSITTHLAGIDTALASAGGGATLTVRSGTTYTLSASDAAGIHIWYGAANTSTFTVTMPDISNVLSTAASVNGVPVETFEVYVGRAQAGDITISAADGIDLLGDGSVTYSTTQTVNAGQWVKLIGWYVSGTTQRYIMDSAAQPRDAALDSISGLTTAADQLLYTTASDTYAVASLTAAGRALLDDADASAQRATLNLGDAATLNAGTGANELVQLDASSRLPAVDGSQLINLPSSNLDGLSDVTITGAAAGEVLRYNGANWVDAQLSYNDLSNTPTLPSSSDDLTSDHTGVNYTGANTDTVTTHLSGIDSELNNRADTVNSVAVSNGAVTIDGDDIIAPRTGTNYTGANTDSITTHLAGIDTALASAGGASDLNGLSDVTITAAATGEILRYNGANWVDAPLSIIDDPSPQLGGDLDLNNNGISSHLVPSTSGKDIGTASAEWRNLYLADNSKILFGLDQDVELIHDPDDGLILDLGIADGTHDPQLELRSQSSASFGARLTFTADSTSPAQNDRVGQMRFQGKDSAGNLQEYGYIYGLIKDPTSGAEAGKISILAYPASANNRGLHVEGVAGQIGQVKVNIDHDGSSYGLHLNNTLVTSTANELNLLDGGTAVGSSITIVDTDGVIVNDGGTSKLVPASDLKTYIGGGGSSAPSVTSASPATTYAITNTSTAHQVYLLTPTANVDVTLPSAATAGSGSRYDVKNLASGFSLTLKGQTGDNIDGVQPATGIIIGTKYESLTVISDGSEWFII